MIRTIAHYGWRPDTPDQRDIPFAPTRAMLRKLPAKVDNSQLLPATIDQGSVGSCVGCSCVEAYGFISAKQGRPFIGSALFAYWNARRYIKSTSWDSGAEIRDGIKGLNQYGLASEATWPYVESRVTTKPTRKSFTEGLSHQAIKYERIDNIWINNLRAAIAAERPVVFGFSVYESFDRITRTGVMPMPKRGESLIGGHAVVALGYDDRTRRVKCSNHWGTSWGDKGFFHMPYDFITNVDLATDFWALEAVE